MGAVRRLSSSSARSVASRRSSVEKSRKLKRTARFILKARSPTRKTCAPWVSTRSTEPPRAPFSRKETTACCPLSTPPPEMAALPHAARETKCARSDGSGATPPPDLVAGVLASYISRQEEQHNHGATMQIRADFAELVGNTPLVRLKRASEETGCEILGKCRVHEPRRQSSRTAPRSPSSRTPRRRACCGRAGSSSRAPPAIPASGWRSSAMRAAIAP